MNIKGVEVIRPTLEELARYNDEYFSIEVGKWSMAERERFAGDLYDFLTAGSPEDSDVPSFIRAVGRKETLWNSGYWNVGTKEIPVLWNLEGVGDKRKSNLAVYIPVALRYQLDLMYHGDSEQQISPWHQNLLDTIGAGISGYNFTATIGTEKVRFSGTNLSKDEFVNFATFGSGSRLLSIARGIANELGIS